MSFQTPLRYCSPFWLTETWVFPTQGGRGCPPVPSLFSLRELIALDDFANAFPQSCPSSSPVPVKHTKTSAEQALPQRLPQADPARWTLVPDAYAGTRRAEAACWKAIAQVAKANPGGRRWQRQLRPLITRRHQPRGGHGARAPREGSPRPPV